MGLKTIRFILDSIHRLVYMTKNHNVSETGSVSILRWMGQDRRTQLGPLERASLNHIYQTMDKVQNKPYSSVQHTPSSESFKVYLWVSSLQLLLALASAVIFRSQSRRSRRTHDHILLSESRLPQPGWQSPRIYVIERLICCYQVQCFDCSYKQCIPC
jgi:hypothetical protein